jgi:NAD/NADP transhydrogenase beta subunit
MFPADQRGPRADQRVMSPVPVLMSLLAVVAGISSATLGLVVRSTAMMFAGMILGGVCSVLIQLIAKATSRRPQAPAHGKETSASHFIDR